MASEKRPAEGRKKAQTPLDQVIDTVQEKRRGRGGKSPDTIDKAIDKAQESGLTDKLARKAKDKLSGRRSGSHW